MKWSDIDLDAIEIKTVKDRVKFTYKDGPFKFQIPRGMSSGVGVFKSINVDVGQAAEFIEWWSVLEKRLCNQEPFKSNMNDGTLRLKIEDRTNIFNEKREISFPTIEEGLFKNLEVSCLIEVDGQYYFNDVYGLVVKCTQLMFFGEASGPCFLEE
jgi:hypothetical protein